MMENNNEKEFYDNLTKSPVSQIGDQLQRIYKHAYEKKDFELSGKVISVIEGILGKAMEYEDNDDIIRLFTSKGYGYILYNLLEITLRDRSERSEKLSLASSLFTLPLNFLRSDKIIFRYLDYLAPEHIFYMVKKIIDENDFEFFTYFVRESTLKLFDFEPAEIADQIVYDHLWKARQYPQLEKISHELEFFIKIECALKHRNLLKFVEKLESYKQLLLETKIFDANEVESKIVELKQKSLRYYVNSLIFKATFWIGAYLVYKGKEYGRYLQKLWNISNPEEDPTTYLNKPPIPTDLTWSILQVLGSGDTPQFADFQSAEPFLYKYLGMIFLKSKELFSFPAPMDLKSLVENDEDEILGKWMGICDRLESNVFLKNTENLDEKVDLAQFFDYDNAMDVLKNRIERMQHDAKECEKTIERLRPMDQTFINDAISLALKSYEKYSQINLVSTIILSDTKSSEFQVYMPKFALPRHAFQEVAGVSTYLDMYFESIAQEISRYEIGLVMDKISKIKRISKGNIKLENLRNDLENWYNKMKSKNHEPDLIFIPYVILAEFQKQTHSPYAHQMTLGGKVLETIYHHGSKNEIILACKKAIEITYLKTEQGRLTITINDDPTNTQNAIITYSMTSKIEILDVNGISKLTVSGTERSSFYRKTQMNKK